MKTGQLQRFEKKFNLKDGKLVVAHIIVAFAALLIGGIAGLLQTMVKSGTIKLPYEIGYY
jgi:cytochrome c oxidase subunit 1